MDTVRDSAQAYARDGWAVVPVHHPTPKGCSCGRSTCDSVGKHPRTKNGFKDATTDLKTIERWWRKWPEANIGMPAGDGLVVIDIDGEVGEEQARVLDLPPTSEVRTGRGRHLYYKGSSPARQGIRPKIDVRGERSMIVLPPSRHYSGVVYEWANDLPMADLPHWVTEESQKTASSTTGKRTNGRPTVLNDGERNDRLFRWASAMRNLSMTESEIAAALDVTNAECCQPPLDPDEVTTIAASAAKYPIRRLSDATLLDLRLGPIATTVYLAMRRLANRNNQCWASYEWLAEQTGVGRTAVSEALALLREVELIEWERRPNTSNLYTLLPDPLIQETR